MSAPQTHSAKGRFGSRMVQQAEFTQADVAAAISRFLGAPPNSSAVAAIASRINVKGIQLSPGGDLAQSGDFQNRILAAGGSELAQIADPARIAQLLQDQAQRANVTSAEGARLGHVLEKASGWYMTEAGASGGNSGHRLKDLPDSARLDRVMQDAQALALKTPGLEWAAHHHGLLLLGPAAMKVLADTHFREESFKRMKGVGFEDKDVVDLAKYAKKKGIDANKAAEVTSDSVRIFGGGDPARAQQWRNHFNELHRNPDNPDVQKRFQERLREQEKAHPEHREQIRKLEEIYKLTDKARADADLKVATRDANAAFAGALANEWNTPAAPATVAPPASPTPPGPAVPAKKAEGPSVQATNPAQPSAPVVQAAPKPGG